MEILLFVTSYRSAIALRIHLAETSLGSRRGAQISAFLYCVRVDTESATAGGLSLLSRVRDGNCALHGKLVSRLPYSTRFTSLSCIHFVETAFGSRRSAQSSWWSHKFERTVATGGDATRDRFAGMLDSVCRLWIVAFGSSLYTVLCLILRLDGIPMSLFRLILASPENTLNIY